MKILKPQRIFLENLTEIENIYKELKDDESIENRIVSNC